MKYNDLDIRTRILFNKPYKNEIQLKFNETDNLINEWLHTFIPGYLSKNNLKDFVSLSRLREHIINDYISSLNKRNVVLDYNINEYEKYIANFIIKELSHIKEIKIEVTENDYFETLLNMEIDKTFFENYYKGIIINPFDDHIDKIINEDDDSYQTIDDKDKERKFLKEKESMHYFEVIRNDDDIARLKRTFTISQTFIHDSENAHKNKEMFRWLSYFRPLLLEMPEVFRIKTSKLNDGTMEYTYTFKNPYLNREINI